MKAVLLAAGIGRRMGADAPPKSLLEVGHSSLLKLTLESLRAAGILDVVLVVGYQKDRVAAQARAHAGPMKLAIVENPRYLEGAILSLWSARDYLDDDVMVMDADVLCPPAGIERLVRSPHRNCILVDGRSEDTGEEQMVFGTGKRALTITKRPSLELRKAQTVFGESIGFLKLTVHAAGILKKLLEEKVEAGVVGIEHEQVYPQLFEKVEVGFERVDGLAWIEVDTPADLKRAEEEVLPLWSMPPCINRQISGSFLPWIGKWPVTPNQWTFLSLLLGWVALYGISLGSYRAGLAGALFFQLFYIVDNWDGEVARLKGLSSQWGGWFDVGVDGVVQVALPLALAASLKRRGEIAWVDPLSVLAATGMGLSFLVTGWAKAYGFGPGVVGDSFRGRPSPSTRDLTKWIQVNLTHENFSLLVAAALVLDARLFFLMAIAVGSQGFWIHYFWRERRRLWVPSLRGPR